MPPLRPAMTLSHRLAITLTFVLGVALAGALFYRQQASVPRVDPRSDTEAAARAHEAAGIEVNSVAPTFEARVHAARQDLAGDPDDLGRIVALAHLLHDGHRPEEAVTLYRRAIALAPDSAMLRYDLAGALAETGDFVSATRELEAWLEIEPGDARTLFNLGAMRANAGDIPAARQWFERALDATDDPALRSQARAAIERLDAGRPDA